MPSKKKPAKKVRRVVLGTGHPWFLFSQRMGARQGVRTVVCLGAREGFSEDVRLNFGNLGNWNKIRLVAEVLK